MCGTIIQSNDTVPAGDAEQWCGVEGQANPPVASACCDQLVFPFLRAEISSRN
jgi:hypothetical protein